MVAAPPRRVLHVCDFFLRYTTGLARGMADQGCSVTMLTRSHDLEFGGVPGAMRTFVARTGGTHIEHSQLPGRVRDPAQLRTVGALRRRLRRFKPETVHFQDGVTNDLRLVLVAGVRLKRYAVTVHDATAHPGERRSLRQRLSRDALLRGSGLIFVHSEGVRQSLVEQVRGLPPIELVPHGIDVADPAPLPERPSLLFFGRIATYYKGLDVLLDAMPLIWERVPDVTLTIAGSGQVDAHVTLRDPRVVLRNEHVPDGEVPALFAAASCCVLPYREASQSGVGSQARAYGRPIVASDVGGLPELVGDNAGRLVPPGQPAALAAAVTDVLTTPGLAESMSRASAAWVESAGWSRVAAVTLQAYGRHGLLREHATFMVAGQDRSRRPRQ